MKNILIPILILLFTSSCFESLPEQNEEKKANQNEMQKVRLELERALKKMSKSEAHDELLKVQLDNNVSVILM